MNSDMDKNILDLKRFVKTINMDAHKKIFKHLEFPIRDRDAAFVSATDSSELNHVTVHWAQKILGAEPEEAKQAVEKVAEVMKKDRHKNRITFYYLVAEKLDKLDNIPL